MEAPVVRLVNVILLSAIKKGATRVIVADNAVHFEIGGALQLDTDVPGQLHGYLIRRLGVMANLPAYGTGQSAHGQIMLEHRGDITTFAIEITGHGDAARAELQRI